MEKREREAIMRQGVTLPETPRERRELAGLDEDLRSLPERGRPTRLRLRNFRPAASSYLAAARGPLAYMVRLHVIEAQSAELDALRRERGHMKDCPRSAAPAGATTQPTGRSPAA